MRNHSVRINTLAYFFTSVYLFLTYVTESTEIEAQKSYFVITLSIFLLKKYVISEN